MQLEISEFKIEKGSLSIRFMSEFVADDTLLFYVDGGVLRCKNKHMSREFVQSVLARAGELLILDGIGNKK